MLQDVYRRLSQPQASSGILRLRTSPEFKVLRYYGRLFADPQVDNLHHVIGCDANDSFAGEQGPTQQVLWFCDG